MYRAFKKLDVTFAPLPVFLRGGTSYQRIEPDFVLYKDRIMMIVEIDGLTIHGETPVVADKRLGLFKHEGADYERVSASECETEALAEKCAKEIFDLLEKYKGQR